MDNNEIKISGKVQNLKILMEVLALQKGEDLLFPFRKLVAQKKDDGTRLLGRQLASAGSVYSQVFLRPTPEDPFLTVSGEGDFVLDMEKATSYIHELSTFDEGFIKYDPITKKITFGSIKSATEIEEYVTREPGEASANIDDARNLLGIACDCNGNQACAKCKGSGVLPSPALTYKNKINIIPPDKAMYPVPAVKLDIDAAVMRAIGDKATLFNEDVFPITFDKDTLSIRIADENDITKDSFLKSIPVAYAMNDMVGEQVLIGEFYKYVFNNLTGVVTIYTAKLPPEDKSIYVTMNKPGGFHTGIQIQARTKVQ